jgi:hypothetical protein
MTRAFVQLRTIKYNLGDLDAVVTSRQQLITQTQHAGRRPSQADNPIRAYASRRMRNLSDKFLLLVGPPESWPDFEITRIAWLPEVASGFHASDSPSNATVD